jgi:hypothetical protein
MIYVPDWETIAEGAARIYRFAALVVGRPFDLCDPSRLGSRWN